MQSKLLEKAGKLAVGRASSRDEAVLNEGGNRCYSVRYNFSEDGGSIATYSFSRNLPEGAIVTNVYSDEISALTSGGSATLQLQCGAQNLTDALAFDTGFASSQSQALASSATAIKISSESELKLDVAGAALTAGEVRFFVEFKLQNDQK